MAIRLKILMITLLLLGTQAVVAQEMGKTVILRTTGTQQSARACQIYEGDELLTNLSNREAVLLELPGGRHTLQTRLRKGPFLGAPVSVQPGAYSFYELKLYKTRGILPSSGYRFRIVPLSPKRMFVLLRDEDWLRRDLGEEEYEALCKMLKVTPLLGRSR